MNLIFCNPQEHNKWTKENYQRACMTLAGLVPIYKCAAMPFPWVSYWALSQSPKPSLFCPEDSDLGNYIRPDGTINTKLKNLFTDFAAKIGVDIPFNELVYEASLNVYEGPVDAAIWIGFNNEIPDNVTGKEFDKYVKAGKAYFINAETGEVEGLSPPWRTPSEPHLTEVEGDIFEGKWDYMVHCANCYHTMGGGIAAIIARDYPEAVHADNATPKDEDKIGTYSLAVLNDGRKIVNLYGQSDIGNDGHPLNRNARYDHIYNGLFLLFESIKNDDEGAEIAIPHGMCCGLAGGDWNIVMAIIKSLQERFAARVTIYRKIA